MPRESNYQYPLDPAWSTEELTTVIAMFRVVEDAYETGVDRQRVLDTYQRFKTVVVTSAAEKRLGKDFERVSGYQLYQVVKRAKARTAKHFKMEVAR